MYPLCPLGLREQWFSGLNCLVAFWKYSLTLQIPVRLTVSEVQGEDQNNTFLVLPSDFSVQVTLRTASGALGRNRLELTRVQVVPLKPKDQA